MHTTPVTLAQVRSHAVPAGHITLWWLGQLGFLLKTPGGTIVALDPYLSGSTEKPTDPKALDTSRQFPPLMKPGDLTGIDAYVLTHTHGDHCDPQTIAGYRAADGRGPYIAPGETVEKLQTLGVPAEQITLTYPNKVHRIGDLTIRTTFAIPFGGDDLTHVGYLFSLDGGPRIYFTCDTGYEDILPLSVKPHAPDVMVAVINGGWRNLSTNDAAKLARELDVKVAIPCHYDLMSCNLASPLTFKTNLTWMGIGERYRELRHGVAWTYPE